MSATSHRCDSIRFSSGGWYIILKWLPCLPIEVSSNCHVSVGSWYCTVFLWSTGMFDLDNIGWFYVCAQPMMHARPHFYQTRSAWSMDQGSNENHSPVNNFVPTVTKFCVLWEGQALPQDTKFGNCRDKIVDSRAFISWSLIHGSSWSGLIKLGPGCKPRISPVIYLFCIFCKDRKVN